MKVALVYDRVNKWGGAERVLLTLHKMFPEAPLYTSVYDSKNASWAKVFPQIKTSFLQKIPFTKNNHEFLAVLMPLAFLSFDFHEYDLVISVTSEFAKAVRPSGNYKHVCICLTPIRYLWSGHDEYFRNPLLWFFSRPAVIILRILDKHFATYPDKIISISSAVKARVKKYYNLNTQVLFPPVTIPIQHYKKAGKMKKEYYLLVSRLDFGYKKVDLVINTFKKLKLPLVIVGTGRQSRNLRKIAKYGKIIFAGKLTDQKLSQYYSGAKALIMPQEEDFGIVALEAQAFGTPVIAYGQGGAKDTVLDGKTGLLFKNQTQSDLTAAILRFEKLKFKADNLLKHAKKFSTEKFEYNFAKIIQNELKRR